MKRLLLCIAVINLFGFAACNKTTTTPTAQTPTTPTTPTTPSIPTDGWELDGVKYTQTWAANTGGSSMSAGDGSPGTGNSINFFFSALPTTNGTYRVIEYNGGGTTIGSNEVGVSAGLETSQKTYVSRGTGNIDITVTITNGKMKIELPEIDVAEGSNLSSTVKLKGTLIES